MLTACVAVIGLGLWFAFGRRAEVARAVAIVTGTIVAVARCSPRSIPRRSPSRRSRRGSLSPPARSPPSWRRTQPPGLQPHMFDSPLGRRSDRAGHGALDAPWVMCARRGSGWRSRAASIWRSCHNGRTRWSWARGLFFCVDIFLLMAEGLFRYGLPRRHLREGERLGGNGGCAGVIMGILSIILLIRRGTPLAEMPMNLSSAMTPTKGTAYRGLRGRHLRVAEVHLRDHERGLARGLRSDSSSLIAGYGSWMKFRSPRRLRPRSASGGSDGGFTA